MAEWFRHLASVPGLDYAGSPGVDRSKLPGHNAIPKVGVTEFEGKRDEYLMWPSRGGGTSASPAHQMAFDYPRGKPARDILRHCYEAVELPGTASDYHFAIQSCIEGLWNCRRAEPMVLEHVERLCWLDIRLIELRPDVITLEDNGNDRYFAVLAFKHLGLLYQREGFLHEALDVAERAARFEQGDPESIRQRIAALEAEDAS